MRTVYLAATGMNRGKTTFALGLVAALMDRGLATGFMKPVGQRYAVVDGIAADEDAILVRSVFGIADDLATMSPVHIPRGFTKAFIEGRVTDDLGARIRAAYATASVGRNIVVVEGTGHAGVGSVIGLSNADVAALLGTPAVIISEAGVGRPIDEIVLNHALFARRGVEVLGAVVNKVDADAHPSLPDVLRKGLARHGIPLLGTLPYRPILSNPTLSMLVEQLPGELLHAGDDLDRQIEHVAIGAMQPRHVIERIGPGSLLIVPGDREDVVHATIAANRRQRALQRDGLLDRFRAQSRFGRASAIRPGPSWPASCSRVAIGPSPGAGGHPTGRHVRVPRAPGHVSGGVARPRPAGQDAPRRPGQDRGDQGARGARLRRRWLPCPDRRAPDADDGTHPGGGGGADGSSFGRSVREAMGRLRRRALMAGWTSRSTPSRPAARCR